VLPAWDHLLDAGAKELRSIRGISQTGAQLHWAADVLKQVAAGQHPNLKVMRSDSAFATKSMRFMRPP